MIRITVIVVSVAAIAVVGYTVIRIDHTKEEPVTVRQILPVSAAGMPFEANPGQYVDFRYEVSNLTRRTYNDVRLGLNCECEATEETPSVIRPGETVQVAFRVRAPGRGTVTRNVWLLSDSDEPLAECHASISVPTTVPSLVDSPREFHVKVVAGDASSLHVTLQTIEQRDSQPWIEALAITPESLVTVKETHLEEARELDPHFVRRIYTFTLSYPLVSVGIHHGQVEIRTRQNPPDPIGVIIEKLDSVAIAPNPLVLSGHKSRNLAVVFRRGVGSPQVIQYDDKLLSVRRVDSESGNSVKAAQYEISPKEIGPFETKITFETGDGEEREVVVVAN